jgi:hypothetical protein
LVCFRTQRGFGNVRICRFQSFLDRESQVPGSRAAGSRVASAHRGRSDSGSCSTRPRRKCFTQIISTRLSLAKGAALLWCFFRASALCSSDVYCTLSAPSRHFVLLTRSRWEKRRAKAANTMCSHPPDFPDCLKPTRYARNSPIKGSLTLDLRDCSELVGWCGAGCR